MLLNFVSKSYVILHIPTLYIIIIIVLAGVSSYVLSRRQTTFLTADFTVPAQCL